MPLERRYFARDEDRITFYEGLGTCAAPGPYGAVCTNAFPNHASVHHDTQTGETWDDTWTQDPPEGYVP